MQKDEFQTQLRELVDGVMGGKLSRREAIRRAGLLGVSAPVAAMLIRSGVASAQDATPTAMEMGEVGSTIVVPADLRTDLSGQEITVVLAEASSPDVPFLDAAHAKFTEATGITVNRIPGEQSTTDRLAIYNQQLGAQSSDIDVMQIDVIPTRGMNVYEVRSGDIRLGWDSPVDEIVHLVAGVSLHPCEGDFVAAVEVLLDEGLPQVLVGDRPLLGIQPTAGNPPFVPAFVEAVDHVGRVADDVKPTGIGKHRLECRGDLHALVGGGFVESGGVRTAGDGPGPPARSRVVDARAIGVDDGCVEVASCHGG